MLLHCSHDDNNYAGDACDAENDNVDDEIEDNFLL